MSEADLKRDLVRQLLKEGGFARRLEDRFAVGTLDLLLLTQRHMIYAEVKLIPGLVALPARVTQREQIRLFNAVGNPYAKAIVIAFKEGFLGFGLPGQRWDEHYTAAWPGTTSLTDHLNNAIGAIFSRKELANDPRAKEGLRRHARADGEGASAFPGRDLIRGDDDDC